MNTNISTHIKVLLKEGYVIPLEEKHDDDTYSALSKFSCQQCWDIVSELSLMCKNCQAPICGICYLKNPNLTCGRCITQLKGDAKDNLIRRHLSLSNLAPDEFPCPVPSCKQKWQFFSLPRHLERDHKIQEIPTTEEYKAIFDAQTKVLALLETTKAIVPTQIASDSRSSATSNQKYGLSSYDTFSTQLGLKLFRQLTACDYGSFLMHMNVPFRDIETEKHNYPTDTLKAHLILFDRAAEKYTTNEKLLNVVLGILSKMKKGQATKNISTEFRDEIKNNPSPSTSTFSIKSSPTAAPGNMGEFSDADISYDNFSIQLNLKLGEGLGSARTTFIHMGLDYNDIVRVYRENRYTADANRTLVDMIAQNCRTKRELMNKVVKGLCGDGNRKLAKDITEEFSRML